MELNWPVGKNKLTKEFKHKHMDWESTEFSTEPCNIFKHGGFHKIVDIL